jgi:hypothetical protein
MYLTPDNIKEDQISRLVIKEEVRGDKIVARVTAGSVLVQNSNSRHVELTFKINGAEVNESSPVIHQKTGEFLEKTIVQFVKGNPEIKRLEIEATIMVVEDGYLVVGATPVLERMIVHMEKGGKEESVYLSPTAVADHAHRIGFYVANLMPIPTSLGVALKERDMSSLNTLKKKIKGFPSLYGDAKFRPDYCAVLNSYRDESEITAVWKL